MTDPERDHLTQRIRDLERRLRRWQATALLLLGLLALPVVLGGLLGVAWAPRLQQERARAAEMERVARQAVDEAIDAKAEADLQRDVAERAMREAQKRLATGKD
jgi:hypothetical protein